MSKANRKRPDQRMMIYDELSGSPICHLGAIALTTSHLLLELHKCQAIVEKTQLFK